MHQGVFHVNLLIFTFCLSVAVTNFEILQVLGSWGFQWCGFHSCAFSKNSSNIQVMQFSVDTWMNFFTHSFLVTNDSGAAGFFHVDFCQTLKHTSQGLILVHIFAIFIGSTIHRSKLTTNLLILEIFKLE